MGLFTKYRESFLRCLSGDSTQIGTAAVRVLVRTFRFFSLTRELRNGI